MLPSDLAYDRHQLTSSVDFIFLLDQLTLWRHQFTCYTVCEIDTREGTERLNMNLSLVLEFVKKKTEGAVNTPTPSPSVAKVREWRY